VVADGADSLMPIDADASRRAFARDVLSPMPIRFRRCFLITFFQDADCCRKMWPPLLPRLLLRPISFRFQAFDAISIFISALIDAFLLGITERRCCRKMLMPIDAD